MTKDQKKKCSKCGESFPNTSRWFRPAKTCVAGLSCVCRKCFADHKRKWKERTGRYKIGPLNKRTQTVVQRFASDPIFRIASTLRAGVVKRGHVVGCDLTLFTKEYFYERLAQNPMCECCGQDLDLSDKEKGAVIPGNSPSVDRINPSLGYVDGNVAILCWRCNRVKSDATLKELEILLQWMESNG